MKEQYDNEKYEQDIYIKKILAKLKKIGDPELNILVKTLINERNYFSSIANYDALTGLHNRRILEIIKNIENVVIIDIDDFKRINDLYGHDIGDKVIKAVANILTKNTNKDDIVCRFGGDEFIIIFSNPQEEIVMDKIQNIADAITYEIKIVDDIITVSVGVAINNTNDDINSLIKMADIALQESKTNGKMQINKFNCYNYNHYKKLKKTISSL